MGGGGLKKNVLVFRFWVVGFTFQVLALRIQVFGSRVWV